MFKIAKAELFKILHMPIFYIILIIIMSSSFIVSIFFDKKYENNITEQPNYSYSNFILYDKTNFDENLVELDNVINIFNTTDQQIKKLSESLSNVYEAFDNLDQSKYDGEISSSINNIKAKLQIYKTNLLNKKDYYEDKTSISYKLLSSDIYTSNICKDIETLISTIENVENLNLDNYPTQRFNILTAYDVSNYETKLKNAYDNAINYGSYTMEILTTQVVNSINKYYFNYMQSSPETFNKNISLAYNLYNNAILNTENYSKILTEVISDGYIALINNEDYIYTINTINKFISDCKAKLPPSQQFENLNGINIKANHDEIIKLIGNNNIIKTIKYTTNSLIFIDLDPELINEFDNIKNKTLLNKDSILNKININKDSKNVSNLILTYKLMCENSRNLVKNIVIKNAVNDLPQDISSSIYGSEFKNYSKYKLNENIEKQYYYLNTNTYDNSYINEPVLSFKSNNNLNFIYTSIKISSIFLIVVSILFAAILITKEQKNGSMKFLISKPYSRMQILSGKHLTLFILISFYLLIALLSAFISSNILFGAINAKSEILLIFNATNAFKINIILYFILFTLTQIFEVFFYALIACMLAFMFWSVLGTLLTSITSIGTIFAINYLFKSELWSSYLPFYNANLFKYFGSGLKLDANNIFQELLLSNINSNSNFFLSLAIIATYSIVIYITTFIIAKKRNY